MSLSKREKDIIRLGAKMQIQRPSWDEYFMKMALLVAERSTCLRRHVGAVIVKDKRILATGYNGASKGLEHCTDIGCLRDELKIASGKDKHICRSVHAEQNALIQAALHGISVKGASLYSTHDSCSVCAKMMINAGIKKFVSCSSRKENEFEDMFKKAGIEFKKMEKPEAKINSLDYYK